MLIVKDAHCRVAPFITLVITNFIRANTEKMHGGRSFPTELCLMAQLGASEPHRSDTLTETAVGGFEVLELVLELRNNTSKI